MTTDLRKLTIDQLKDTLSCARDKRLVDAVKTEIARRYQQTGASI